MITTQTKQLLKSENIRMIDKELIYQSLKDVIDPELGKNLVEINLIREINIEDKNVFIKMTLTTPFCPLVNYLVQQVKEKVAGLDGVEQVDVQLVWS